MTILLSTLLAGFSDRAEVLRGLTPRVEEAGTSRTLGTADNGTNLIMTNTALCTITLAATALPLTQVVIDNLGTGGVMLVEAAGATLQSILGYTGVTPGGTVVLRVVENADDASAVWKLTGEGE